MFDNFIDFLAAAADTFLFVDILFTGVLIVVFASANLEQFLFLIRVHYAECNHDTIVMIIKTIIYNNSGILDLESYFLNFTSFSF